MLPERISEMLEPVREQECFDSFMALLEQIQQALQEEVVQVPEHDSGSLLELLEKIRVNRKELYPEVKDWNDEYISEEEKHYFAEYYFALILVRLHEMSFCSTYLSAIDKGDHVTKLIEKGLTYDFEKLAPALSSMLEMILNLQSTDKRSAALCFTHALLCLHPAAEWEGTISVEAHFDRVDVYISTHLQQAQEKGGGRFTMDEMLEHLQNIRSILEVLGFDHVGIYYFLIFVSASDLLAQMLDDPLEDFFEEDDTEHTDGDLWLKQLKEVLDYIKEQQQGLAEDVNKALNNQAAKHFCKALKALHPMVYRPVD